jgi:outer membrane lipoprotein SlyB
VKASAAGPMLSSPRAAALGLTLTGAALAQTPARVRGTIEKVDGDALTVKSREGATVVVKVPDNVSVAGVRKRSLADIKANDFVGIAALPQSGKSSRALEVLIFPEAMRGTGEGHRGWDLLPESTMTNASVTESVTKVDGYTLPLKYKDGEQIIVPPDTPIVTFAPGDKSELKPGAVVATKADDGTLSAARITVGRDVPPPM